MRLAPLVALLALGAPTLGACMMGPDFHSPDPPATNLYLADDQPAGLVAAGIPGGEAQQIVQGLDIPGQWWAVFRSQPLDRLIHRALIANPDIHAAAAALRAAQFTARAQRATLFPTVQAGVGASQNQVSNVLSPPTVNPDVFIYSLFTAGFTISYTLDLFGANRRAIESLEALAEAQCFQLEAAYLSLASNVVAAAIQEASLRAQIEATQRIIAAQRETLDILRRQEGLGAVTGADVAQQEAALAQAEATLPPLQKALAQGRNLLATLSGRVPSVRVAEYFELSDLVLPPDLPLSLPSRLVEQRPDIRAAEANLHSASAQVGVATANQFPQITLNAGFTPTSIVFDQLFLPGQLGSVAGASILQTVLDGGALAAKKKAAQAQLEQADAQYRSTVLTAFRNVADTLRALEYDAIALQAAVASERAASTSFTIARHRLDLGDTTYVVVLIAELTYQQALLARVQAQANRFTDAAALFQALGGGWWNRDDDLSNPAQRLTCRPPRPLGAAPKTAALK
jgi:NodT family efflux transporter outer membrane factor (OMF) lipoprotein